MKRSIAIFSGLVFAMLFQLAQAAPALVHELTGTVQAIPGVGTPRTLRKGDDVNQGETVVTEASSSVVLRFEDGQVVALTGRSRLAINAYVYNRVDSTKSNVLLSLVQGGMRAFTGLIGKRSPSRISYRAGNATVGIRGTDVTIATLLGDVVLTVTEGEISFTFGGQTISIPAGQGVIAKADGTFQQRAAAQIAQQVPPALQEALGGLQNLESAIQDAIRRAAAETNDFVLPPLPLLPPGSGPDRTLGGGSSSTR